MVQSLPTEPGGSQNNLAMGFLAVCGVAFILLAGAVMYKKLLDDPEPAAQVAVAETAPTPAPGEVEQPVYEEEEQPAEHVIDLELEEIDGEYKTAARVGARKKGGKKGGKTLTEEQKAQLARMGGGFGTTPTNLRKRSASSAQMESHSMLQQNGSIAQTRSQQSRLLHPGEPLPAGSQQSPGPGQPGGGSSSCQAVIDEIPSLPPFVSQMSMRPIVTGERMPR